MPTRNRFHLLFLCLTLAFVQKTAMAKTLATCFQATPEGSFEPVASLEDDAANGPIRFQDRIGRNSPVTLSVNVKDSRTLKRAMAVRQPLPDGTYLASSDPFYLSQDEVFYPEMPKQVVWIKISHARPMAGFEFWLSETSFEQGIAQQSRAFPCRYETKPGL